MQLKAKQEMNTLQDEISELYVYQLLDMKPDEDLSGMRMVRFWPKHMLLMHILRSHRIACCR